MGLSVVSGGSLLFKNHKRSIFHCLFGFLVEGTGSARQGLSGMFQLTHLFNVLTLETAKVTHGPTVPALGHARFTAQKKCKFHYKADCCVDQASAVQSCSAELLC